MTRFKDEKMRVSFVLDSDEKNTVRVERTAYM